MNNLIASMEIQIPVGALIASGHEKKDNHTCRLYGIDTPETPKSHEEGKHGKQSQPYGDEDKRTQETCDRTTIGSNAHRTRLASAMLKVG